MRAINLSTTTLAILGICCCASAGASDSVDTSKPIKVFVLAGQSNMQGHGRISLEKDGDLDYAAKLKQFAYLKKGGEWSQRRDVWYYHKAGRDGVVTKGELRIGLGANEKSIGPELVFGHLMGDHFKEQVLLIKCAWGGQPLGGSFRPPSSGNTGEKYKQVLAEVKDVVANLEPIFPDYEDQGFEMVGFFWHQGWNDGCNREFSLEYEENMVNFIKDMRKDLGNEDLPFVIATSGMGGPNATGVAGWLSESVEPAQMAAAARCERCIAVPTRHYQRHQPGRQKSHWYNSAESYCLIGDAAAKAMIKILTED